MKNYIMNWKRPEKKKAFKSIARFKDPIALPESVDLRPLCPPVVDQGDLGSCTANSLAAAWGFLEIKDGFKDSESFDPTQFVPASRLFLYYQERVIEGDVNRDAGAQISDGLASLQSVGCCDENVWPYIPSKFNAAPSAQAYSEASNHKIAQYAALESLDDMKQALAQGLPFVFGFDVPKGFQGDWNQDEVAIMPTHVGLMHDGHAVCAVGYDDKLQCILVRNSWGTDWGMQGYFWMPYDFISSEHVDEIYVVSK